MAETAFPGMTVLPQYQGSALALQQKQMLAQALLQDATQNQASQIPTNMPIMPKFSIGAGLAQLGQGYLAGQLQHQVSQGYQQLGQQQMGALLGTPAASSAAPQPQQAPAPSAPPPAVDAGGMTDGGSGPGVQSFPLDQPSPQAMGVALGAPTGAPTASPAPAQASAGGLQGGLLSAGSTLNPSGMDPTKAAYLYLTMGPTEYAKAFVAPYAQPTDATRAALAAHLDPVSANAMALNKSTFIPPTSGRPGGYLQSNMGGGIEQLPQVPAGYQAIKGADQAWHIVPVDGGVGAIANSQYASTAGTGAALPYAGVDAQGNPLPVTNRTAAATGGAASPMPTIPSLPGAAPAGGAQPPPLPPIAGTAGPTGGPPQSGGAIYAAPPLGATEGQDNLQTELHTKWSQLTAQNQQAQTTTSYLQNIKGLATQAAVGPLSDKLQYVNGLLSGLGVSDRATDATTANNLLDKYSNQIVSRLGTGGLGTDAARTILSSAYPGSHMTAQAINEASDNLIGANQMIQAKTAVLAPLANARNATAYNNVELTFDQNADPRVWQYANIQDPTARAAFAQSVVKQDPKFGQRIQALEKIGAVP